MHLKFRDLPATDGIGAPLWKEHMPVVGPWLCGIQDDGVDTTIETTICLEDRSTDSCLETDRVGKDEMTETQGRDRVGKSTDVAIVVAGISKEISHIQGGCETTGTSDEWEGELSFSIGGIGSVGIVGTEAEAQLRDGVVAGVIGSHTKRVERAYWRLRCCKSMNRRKEREGNEYVSDQ